MSSRRFPGKVLAPLWGKPILWHTINRMIEAGLSAEEIVILTSTHSSDDPVAAYAHDIGFPVFRGPLEDVMARFVGAIEMFPCEWILRGTADSPLYCPEVIRRVIDMTVAENTSFITTTYHRTLPCGTNIEAFRASLLLERLSHPSLTDEDREHVTRIFHRIPPCDGAVSVEFGNSDFSGMSVAVDSPQDLSNLMELEPSRILENIPWHQLQVRRLPQS
jgi:spore coat polysaccharide biosynthesis protein SpsF